MVSFSNFQTLDPETADLARELIDNARRARSAFNSFVSLWMAFNGWMECVTDASTDAEMITAMVDNKRIRDAYEDLIVQSTKFRTHVMRFSAMWPVLNVRDVRRKLGRDAFWRLSRKDLIAQCLRAKVMHQPAGWTEGDVPTWSQLLRTIYAIRCNMFHGSKSPQIRRDHDLVLQADRILRMFIELTSCFDWHDGA